MEIKEIFERVEKERVRWNKEKRIGNIRFSDDEVPSIDFLHGEDDKFVYEIELDRIETASQAFSWICHMTGKTWVTPRMIYDFIQVIKRTTSANEYCYKKYWEGGTQHADNDKGQ